MFDAVVTRACPVKDIRHLRQRSQTLNSTEASRNGLGSGNAMMPPWSVTLQPANTSINIQWEKHPASSMMRIFSHVCIWVNPTNDDGERRNTKYGRRHDVKQNLPSCTVLFALSRITWEISTNCQLLMINRLRRLHARRINERSVSRKCLSRKIISGRLPSSRRLRLRPALPTAMEHQDLIREDLSRLSSQL